MSIPKMVTIAEAAKMCKENQIGVSKNHIRILCKEGKIPCCKIGVKTLINWEGFLNYLNNPPEINQFGHVRIKPVKEKNSV